MNARDVAGATLLRTLLLLAVGLWLHAQGEIRLGLDLGEIEAQNPHERKLRADQARKLVSFAKWSRDRGYYDLLDDALDAGECLSPGHAGVKAAFALDREVEDRSDLLRKSKSRRKTANQRIGRLRRELASIECKIARRREKKETPALARRSYARALTFDPGSAPANRAFGRSKHKSCWCLPDEKPLVDAGFVRVDQDLWVPRGLRAALTEDRFEMDGQLLERTEADQRRSRWVSPWDLRSSHVRVKTTLPFEDAIALPPAAELAWRAAHALFPLGDSRAPILVEWSRTAEQHESRTGGTTSPITWDSCKMTCRDANGLTTEQVLQGTLLGVLLRRQHKSFFNQRGLWVGFGLTQLFYELEHDPNQKTYTFDYDALRRRYGPRASQWLAATGKGALRRLAALADKDAVSEPGLWIDAGTAFVAFLHSRDEATRQKLNDYITRLGKGEAGKDAFEKCFGKPIDAYRKPFQEWLE